MKGPSSRVAKRYARALLALADRNQVEGWGAELERFAKLAEAPEIALSLQSPEISQTARIEAVAKIAEKLELSYPVRSFVVVVARHGRVDEFDAIAQSYRDLLDQMLNRA